MLGLLIAFFSSLIVAYMIIRFNHMHSHFSSDNNLTGPQKFHKFIVPRIGGLSIIFGVFLAIALKVKLNSNDSIPLLLLVSSIPAFAIGIAEDITKKISVRVRLFCTAISAVMLIYLLNVKIVNLGIPPLDFLLTIPLISILFTTFALTGLSNAYNIIDGFHGLASMVGIITLLAIAYVGFAVADMTIVYLSLILVGAILGFVFWNYPRGLIFLGDGGAYLIGFWIGSLTILLVSRHSNISPWFALLVNIYPILETIFTIYRRKIHQGKSPGQPDGIHFHTLIYRRILKPAQEDLTTFSANAKTAPYIWVLVLIGICPAIIFWQSTAILISASLIFILLYLWLYTKIVNFKTPKWLNIDS